MMQKRDILNKDHLKVLKEEEVATPAEDKKVDWIIDRHFLYRSKGMADFEYKLNKNIHNDEMSIISAPKSKLSDKESLFDVVFRDRAQSNFSYHMSDINDVGLPKQKKKEVITDITFSTKMVNLMGMFELKKVYLNDGLYLQSTEFFLEADEDGGVPFPVSIRIQDLKDLMGPEEILSIFQNSVLMILKGNTSLTYIKTHPTRSYYGIKAMIRVQETYDVECLIGVTNDPTFTHEIYHDYHLSDVNFTFNQRIRIA